MPYLNLDDNFAAHPKVAALSPAAFRLHVAGLCYCAKFLTDGLIIEATVRTLLGYQGAALRELIKAGVWDEHPDGYTVHDYLEWNKSRAWWTAERKAAAERQAKYRAEHPRGSKAKK